MWLSSTCPFCNKGIETIYHLSTECPAFHQQRFFSLSPPIVGLQASFYNCGVSCEESCFMDWRRSLYDFGNNGYDSVPLIHDSIVAFTDGACTHQSNPAIRHAGFGVWFNDLHASNISAHLPGMEQTSIRAELYAAMCAILVTTNDLTIKTDCEFVFSNMLKLLSNPTINLYTWDHTDLWLKIQLNISNVSRSIAIEKVRAHCSETDRDHNINPIDVYGNTEADLLAVAGARILQPPNCTLSAYMNPSKILLSSRYD